MYETECIDMKHSERKAAPEPFLALKHIKATFFLSRRGVECWWQGAKGTSLATKF